MPAFIPGRELCERFFRTCAQPILTETFPSLRYSAGLLGYGSDVLGYDDEVSTDHMWGPRFYLFLSREDLPLVPDLLRAFSRGLPHTFEGYSVNFSAPDPDDNGVRHPEFIESGEVSPLIFFHEFDAFLEEYLGSQNPQDASPAEWLTFEEHRLLALSLAQFYVDGLDLAPRLEPLRQYPDDVRRYLIASQWEQIAEEQAFVTRCGARGDELGARLICARIAERLMRLCFLYQGKYAPYSKWFGTAFSRLSGCAHIAHELREALRSGDVSEREEHLVAAQSMTAQLHNQSGLTAPVETAPQNYFGRRIRVIRAERIAEITAASLEGTPLENAPLCGSVSELGGGMTAVFSSPSLRGRIQRLYEAD